MSIVANGVIQEWVPVHKNAKDASVQLRIWSWESTAPQRLALVNPVNDRKYAMVRTDAYKVSAECELNPKHSNVFHLTTASKVIDAYYLRAFSVRSDGKLPKGLKNAKASLWLDGCSLVDTAVSHLLKIPEVVLSKPIAGGMVFHASDEKVFVGYMLPNGSDLRLEVTGLPEEFKPFKLTLEFELATYHA
jgi:hypothetical protein